MKKSTAELLGLLEELDEYLTSGEPVEDPLKLFEELGVIDAAMNLPEIQSTPSLIDATETLVGRGGHKIDAIVWTRRVAQRLRHGPPQTITMDHKKSIDSIWPAETMDHASIQQGFGIRQAFDGTEPEVTIKVRSTQGKDPDFPAEGEVTIGKDWARVQLVIEWTEMSGIVYDTAFDIELDGKELATISNAVIKAWKSEGPGFTEDEAPIGAIIDETQLAHPDHRNRLQPTWITAFVLNAEERLYEQNKANIEKNDEIIQREAKVVVSKRKPKKRKKKGP